MQDGIYGKLCIDILFLKFSFSLKVHKHLNICMPVVRTLAYLLKKVMCFGKIKFTGLERYYVFVNYKQNWDSWIKHSKHNYVTIF